MTQSEKLNEASERILRTPVKEVLARMRGDLTSMQIVVLGDLAKAYTMTHMLQGMIDSGRMPPAALIGKLSEKLEELIFRCGVGVQLPELREGTPDSPEFAKAAQNWEALLNAMLNGATGLLHEVMTNEELGKEARREGHEALYKDAVERKTKP